MNEIEIKAHVYNRENLITLLNEIAFFNQEVTRDDTYWSTQKPDSHSIRIRKETVINQNEKKEKLLLTYKRKKLEHNGKNSIEVNEELETELPDAKPLEAFLKDNGFEISLTKHKHVLDWTISLSSLAETKYSDEKNSENISSIKSNNKKQGSENKILPEEISHLTATIELCNIPPIGDFIEIEILSENRDAEIISTLHEMLLEILKRCNIPEEQIEEKFYRQLLREYEETHKD